MSTISTLSSQASRGVLRDDGFSEADRHCSQIFTKPRTTKKSQRSVVWIDEAGLLPVPQLKKVLETARNYKARVVLVGDTRQHASVERGDALRLLDEKSGLERTELKKTKR